MSVEDIDNVVWLLQTIKRLMPENEAMPEDWDYKAIVKGVAMDFVMRHDLDNDRSVVLSELQDYLVTENLIDPVHVH